MPSPKQPHELGIHGTVDMYRRGECRCEPCTTAFMRSVPHGTLSGSRHHGCTCDPCLTVRRQYGRSYAWARQSMGGAADVAPPPPRSAWTLEQIRGALRAYHDIHGTFPDRKSTDGLQGRTWGAAQKWLRGHGLTFRGLLGMEAWREHSAPKFEWRIETIYAAACAFCTKHDRWPTSKDGAAAELSGRTWGRANGWLREQGLTLAKLATMMGGRETTPPDREPVPRRRSNRDDG